MKTPPVDLSQRLLDVSEDVLAPDPALRLEDVARLVGASRATLYYYFSGRDDLLSFLLTEHMRHGADAMRAAVRDEDGPEARLRAMVTGLVQYTAGRPGMCGGLLSTFGAADRLKDALDAADSWIVVALREVLTEGRDAGVFAAEAPADAAYALMGGLLLAVLGRAMAGTDPADPVFQQHLVDQLLRGVSFRK
ncbi:TetR/AcrR family transcriptional regulator [Catenulispora sp. GAS73]|uniref:TetR/AcrR family transcriptional regulator n=1 Tax=Catenulispora sp. GAS73 TaxID=3156269 RepID=UPI003515B319